MKYPKRYATVTRRVDDLRFEAKLDELQCVLVLNVLWRNGRGSTTAIQQGLRIKLYQRPGRPHPNFRFVGS